MSYLRRDRNQSLLQAIADFSSAAIAWTAYFIYRKITLEPIRFGQPVEVIFDENYLLGLAIIPIAWIVLFQISGSYHEVFRKSRIGIFGNTLLITLIGSLVLFFAISLDDYIASYKYYYTSFSALAVIHLAAFLIQRIIISTLNARNVQRGKIVFKTILVLLYYS